MCSLKMGGLAGMGSMWWCSVFFVGTYLVTARGALGNDMIKSPQLYTFVAYITLKSKDAQVLAHIQFLVTKREI